MSAAGRFALAQQLTRQHLGRELEETLPARMGINAVLESLWPMHARFKPRLAAVAALRYEPRCEAQADQALERLLLSNDDWSTLPEPVWRVLLERQIQALQLLTLKAAEAGDWEAPFMSVPMDAPPALRSALAVAFVLYAMALPFPVADRSDFAWPANAPGSQARH